MKHLELDGGTLAYDVAGSGPLVVLAHGMGDSRAAYRFVAPALVAAGYRAATVDLRGCGDSSADWPSYSRSDIAADLVALVEHLGGDAVLVGHSISGGAATIAAANAPALITAVVELAPFTRRQEVRLADLRVASFRRMALHLGATGLLGSVSHWRKYVELAYPGRRPADWDARLGEIESMLREPGRMKAMQRMGRSTPAEAGAELGKVRCPVLVVMGTADPDWVSPEAEGRAVVAALPPGVGRLELVHGAGHYPHVQHPEQVVDLILSFLAAARA